MPASKRRFAAWVGVAVAAVAAAAFAPGCDDPVPGPIGGLVVIIRTFEARTGRFSEVSHIDIEYERVEAMHRDPLGNQSRVTLDTQVRTITVENLDEDTFVAQFQVPVGFVTQLRFYPRSVTLHLKDGTSVPLPPDSPALPSWANSGWKWSADAGFEFPIVENELTGMRGLMPFDDRLVRPQGNGPGWKIKPHLDAEIFQVNPPPGEAGVYMDQVIVAFHHGTSAATIDAINAEIGATILRAPIVGAGYRIKFPPSTNLEQAYAHYTSKSEVAGVLPSVFLAQHDTTPDEGIQTAHTIANLPPAWDTQRGSHVVRVGIIDDGVNLAHPDLALNIGINQGELPPALFDTSGNGAVEQAEIDARDTDGDGIFSFRDFLGGANADIAPADINGDGIDGGDLIAPGSAWADGNDDDDWDGDPTTFRDDLVGWNFDANTNDPTPAASHGTFVASCLGAQGTVGVATPVGVAGTAWRVSIVPLRASVTTFDASGTAQPVPLDSFFDAAAYAEGEMLDIVNCSRGWHFASEDADTDDALEKVQANVDIPQDQWNTAIMTGTAAFAQNWTNPMTGMVTSRVLYTNSAGNSRFNLSDPNILHVPSEFMEIVLGDNNLVVGEAVDATTPASGSSYGAPVVQIWAPGSWMGLNLAGTTVITQSGTSFAAPTVAGVGALAISQWPALQGNPAMLHNFLVNTATGAIDVDVVVQQDNQPLVNANAAVTTMP